MFGPDTEGRAARVHRAVYMGDVGASSATDWKQWTKPPGVSFVSIIAQGGGGGGGGGCGNVDANAKGGGSGGCSGARTHILYRADDVPNTLWVQAGRGGLGGAGGNNANGANGAAGGLSFVASKPTTVVAQNIWARSGNGQAGGGQGGTSTQGGMAGPAGTIATAALQPPSNLALSVNFVAGALGTAGGVQTGAVGGAQTIGTGLPVLGGCGGAGAQNNEFAGGGTNALANTDLMANPGGAAGGGHGSNGFRHTSAGYSYGGTGGGSSRTTPGGDGGNGCVPGAGGGGGGAGVTQGGRGGDGGPGMVIIECW